MIVAGKVQHAVGNEVLSGMVTFNDSLDEVLGNILVVGKELLGVLGKTVAAVAKRRIVVMCADSGIETYTVDNLLCIKTLKLCVGIKFIEVRYSESKISVGKKLNSFGFGKAHE